MIADFGKNYYKTLGVSKDATKEEITASYRRLAKENHPDFNPNADEEIIREINEAYDILSNQLQRSLYDRYCILDLDEESLDNPYEGNNPFKDNENKNERKSFFGRLKNGFYYDGRSNFFDEELNNPYRDNSYNPEYQRVEDGKSAIYNELDKEIHYLCAFENDIKEKKEELLDMYDYESLTQRLSLPFYNKALILSNEYNFDLKSDSKYIQLHEEITNKLFQLLYKLSRFLENKSYSVLYDINKEDEHESIIGKIDDLFFVIFDLMGMTTGEAFFFQSYFSSKKDLTKQDKKIMKLKYEICMCYVSYRKLTDKIKNKKNKTLTKAK